LPYRPADDSQILERLPERFDPALKDIKRLRNVLAARPNNLELASALARRAIEAARSSGDPRFLGQAQAVLEPWWNMPDPPRQALLLRATIRQSNHDFDGSIADLDRLIAADPANGQALLTRATVLTVQGHYSQALADCARIARLAIPLIAAGCAAAPDSLDGDAARAYGQLTRALGRTRNADAGLVEWAHTLAAEIAERRGDYSTAEHHYREAYALDPRDPYLCAAYSDFLLDRGRARDVLSLVENYTSNDNLLLRLALAEAKLPDRRSHFVQHRNELGDRFEAAHRRGDSLHRREEARFRLALQGDPHGALRLARENWEVQREPADLRILFEAATAAGDAAALREVGDWIAAHRLEDVALGARKEPRS
jgi:tetratricopeptide (TPR) repeat protein